MTEEIRAFMAKGAWSEAKAASQQYVNNLPTNAEAQAYLGLCYFHEANFGEALKCFERATELNPKYWEAGLKVVQCLDRLCRQEEAYAAAVHWQHVHPNDPTLNFLATSLKKYESQAVTDGWQKSKYKPEHHVTFSQQK